MPFGAELFFGNRQYAARRAAELKAARGLLQRQPGWATAQIEVYEGTEAIRKMDQPSANSPERLERALLMLDTITRPHLRVVNNIDTQNAFLLSLQEWTEEAWTYYTGLPIRPPMGNQEPARTLQTQAFYWRNESYKVLAATQEEAKSEALKAKEITTRPIKTKDQRKIERASIRDAYLDRFQEKVTILDLCWAVRQRYREWLRWLSGELKDGSKADKAFRALLTSAKRPEEHRADPRPKLWK